MSTRFLRVYVIPKQPHQIRRARNEQKGRSTNVAPSKGVPAPDINEVREPNHISRSHDVPNIRYPQRDDIIPHDFWLRGCVEDCDPQQRKKQVDIAEL